MQYSPTLIVKRVFIERDSKPVYDEPFHKGLNIIRGENSSGKSTLLNFLFYGLGGDLGDWSEAALLCSRVIVEVELNGKVATLSRDISSEIGQPMDIFGGRMDAALAATRAEWMRYPYKRSTTKESFSQALFRLLHMPEVGNETSGNVTIHQILRLLYADQLSPIESIFRFERFDPPTLRDAVGRLLCGAYDNKLYQNELKIRELNKEFDSISTELRSLFSVLGKTQEGLTLDWIAGKRRVLTEKREAIRREIEAAERTLFDTQAKDKLTLSVQENLYAEVQKLQGSIGSLKEEYDNLTFAIADSANFIGSLEQKLRALNDTNSIAEYVGEVQFHSCPACLSEMGSNAVDSACYLCKSPFDREKAKARIVSIINDTALQLRQSNVLQTHRMTELSKIGKELGAVQESWAIASARLADTRKLPSSQLQDTLRALQRQAGYLEREAEDLENQTSVAQLIDQLSMLR